jgi:hypothetical protein
VKFLKTNDAVCIGTQFNSIQAKRLEFGNTPYKHPESSGMHVFYPVVFDAM